jgi:FG-GAP repeat
MDPGTRRPLLARVATRRLAVVLVATAVLSAGAGVAAAGTNAAAPRVAIPRSSMPLARAPAPLRTAVTKTLGSPRGPRGSTLQQAALLASDAADDSYFGFSVSVFGSTAVIGAYGNNADTGAAYIFTQAGTTWTQTAELTASDGAPGDFYGWSVSLFSTILVVTAFRKNSDTGAAYIYEFDGTNWNQEAELTAPDGSPGDEFGYSASMSGARCVIGAYGWHGETGAAYVFVRNADGVTWSLQGELTASDGAPGDRLAYSVALNGETVVAGAFSANAGIGAAYVFFHTGTGETWAQQAKLTPPDGAALDRFGFSVAVAGDTAVIGAPYKRQLTGSTYVYARSGSTWALQTRLTPSQSAQKDEFGFSVAIYSNTIVTTSPGANSNAGVAFAFAKSGGAWTQEAMVAASDGVAGDDFGVSVAVYGTTVLGGAFFRDDDTGAAYVYALPNQQRVSASDPFNGDSFGISVSISGTTALVGAYLKKSFTGQAYVFTKSGSAWTQQAKLQASDGLPGDSFGYAVALSGSTAVIGAYARNLGTGAAYVFTGSGATWTQVAELTAPDGAQNDSFGESVAVSGPYAVVGAYGHASSTGAAYVFVNNAGTWSQRAELTASDGAPDDSFGWSIAVSGPFAVVGASNSALGAGSVYVFGASTNWSQQAELTEPTPAAGDRFGYAVALSGPTLVVGAFGKYSRAGAAFVFLHNGSAWTPQAQLTAFDGVTGDLFGDAVAVSGQLVVVGASGARSNTGAAYVFSPQGTAWTNLAKLTATDALSGDDLGVSVAVSGTDAFAGASGRQAFKGTAYAFGQL